MGDAMLSLASRALELNIFIYNLTDHSLALVKSFLNQEKGLVCFCYLANFRFFSRVLVLFELIKIKF